MPVPGWYPDPAGAPDRYRYWDGRAWTGATTTDPVTTPPPGRATPGTDQARSGRGPVIAVVAIMAAVALIVVIVLARGSQGTGGDVPEDTNTAAPTGPVWDETSTPTPENTANQSTQRCPVAEDVPRSEQTSGRVTGGGLQIPTISGWDEAFPYLDWVTDFHAVEDTVYPGWVTEVGVGALMFEDGFTDLSTSARQTLECYASSGYYSGYTGRKDLVDEETTVDGHQAWRIQAEVHVSMDNLPQVDGDVVDIYVVDVGSDDHLGVLISSVNIGDTERMAAAQGCIGRARVVD